MRPIQLALCGTFDRLSYGDTAASLVVEAALRKRLADLTLVRYSAGARSASSWPYDVRPFEEFEHDLPGLTGVLIGNLEPLNLSSPSCSSPPAGGIHESAGSWLAPALAASTAGLPVCWNSAAIRDIPEWARPLLTFALSLSRYVSARDENVVAAIRNAGFCGDSPIVPSVLFDIPQLIAARTVGAPLPEAIQKLLPAGNANGDYVVIQDHDLVQPMRATLEHALTQRGITSVFLSLLDVTTGAEPAARPSMPAPDPVNTATLIGHSAGVVALDESLVTTALAYGLPVLLPPVTRNVAGLFAADEVVTGTPDDPVPSAFLDRLGTYVLCARARNATSILDVHWNKLAAQFSQLPLPLKSPLPRLISPGTASSELLKNWSILALPCHPPPHRRILPKPKGSSGQSWNRLMPIWLKRGPNISWRQIYIKRGERLPSNNERKRRTAVDTSRI